MNPKDFDAVAMKQQCQEALERRYPGLHGEERLAAEQASFESSDDPLVVYWRSVMNAKLAKTG